MEEKDTADGHPAQGRFALRFQEHREPEKKRFYNERLFTAVAPRYDFVTRALSLGRDAAWKRRLVESLPSHAAPFCVDLACGTGDVSLLLAEKYPRGTILGLDLTRGMLDIAERRSRFAHVRFEQRDMGATGLDDSSVDIVTGSYALRNAPSLGLVLTEIRRVLRRGGVAAFLDFSRPPGKAAQLMEYWLLKAWGSFWGLALHGNAEVYAYIAESLREFPDRIGLRRSIREAGFEVLGSRRFYLGVMETLMFRKSSPVG
ncbi:MAG: ubiquinone/menaquinone biosynthesis methyltransferase [Pirellulales bacterium]|nr:ubiquinone/menaquinone biosynthesis methyltransferase [Pirellulales bacterium]